MGEEIIGIELEREWKRVNKLLASSHEAAWVLALLEAEKIFVQVLDSVSYGRTIDDRIENAGVVFKDMGKILAAQELCRRMMEEIGFAASRDQLADAVGALTQGVLDMTARDVEPKGWWYRLRNQLNFFWGHHPQLLAGVLLAVLGAVAVIWFLADTSIGQWVTGLGVGFARFVMARKEIVLVLAGLILAASGLAAWRRSGR